MSLPDDYRLKLRPEIIVGECEHCGGEIYFPELYKKTRIGKIHEDCFDDFVSAYLDAEDVEGFGF